MDGNLIYNITMTQVNTIWGLVTQLDNKQMAETNVQMTYPLS